MITAATAYCQQANKYSKVVKAGESDYVDQVSRKIAVGGGATVLTVTLDPSACAPGDDELDFTALIDEQGLDACVNSFVQPLVQSCQQDPNVLNYDPDYPILGGVSSSHCAIWEVTGLLVEDSTEEPEDEHQECLIPADCTGCKQGAVFPAASCER